MASSLRSLSDHFHNLACNRSRILSPISQLPVDEYLVAAHKSWWKKPKQWIELASALLPAARRVSPAPRDRRVEGNQAALNSSFSEAVTWCPYLEVTGKLPLLLCVQSDLLHSHGSSAHNGLREAAQCGGCEELGLDLDVVDITRADVLHDEVEAVR